MNILGISAYYHDAAACLVIDGKIIAAVQEERFTRIKHDSSFPNHAISYCLKEAGICAKDLDHIVFYDKPFLKFERLLETYLAFAPRGFKSFATSLPVWLKDKLFQKSVITKAMTDLWGKDIHWGERLLFSEHHLSHAASAFFPSPFEEAAVLTMDGVGEWTTTSLAIGKGNNLDVIKEIHFPHSLGLLYSAFTYYTGFKVNSGEYKVMGLAPYGEPKYVQKIYDNLLDLKEDGSYHLNLKYFNYMQGLSMTNDGFNALFDGPRRKPESPLTQREMDLAASIQEVVEECMMRQALYLHKETGLENLCMAGGVALNCVGNGKLLRNGPFKNIWIQPAAGDAGGALGAALCTWYGYLDKPRTTNERTDSQTQSLLGPEFSDDQTIDQVSQFGAVYRRVSGEELYNVTADLLAREKVVGWFQGRMEFGPRALGNRSIIGDPRSTAMQATMNLKIKFRESFRPFAPAVLREDVSKYFELDYDSPYMLLVAPIREERRKEMTADQEKLFGIAKLNVAKSDLPAITHVDYSARIQTVDASNHPRFYKLLSAFKQKTGCSVLVNTSFNVRGEPIVCMPADAYACFMRTNMDALIVGDIVMLKEEQPKWQEREDWLTKFELD